ncbi:claudin domain-containing protein 2 [Sigmodon hispidus]
MYGVGSDLQYRIFGDGDKDLVPRRRVIAVGGGDGNPEGGRAWAQPPTGPAHLIRGRGPGLLLLIALAGYTAKNAWKPEVFFSWSYFFGWLALPFSFLAGFCFLLADMIIQSTEAISGFPVCL